MTDPLRQYLLIEHPKQIAELERQKAKELAEEKLKLELEEDRKARDAELSKGIDLYPKGRKTKSSPKFIETKAVIKPYPSKENGPSPRIKERQCKGQGEALELLFDALNEMEEKNGCTPTAAALATYVLCGEFKHSHVKEAHTGKNLSIKNPEFRLDLHCGTILDRDGIIRRYNETIYKKPKKT